MNATQAARNLAPCLQELLSEHNAGEMALLQDAAAHYARKANMARNTDDGYGHHVPSDKLRFISANNLSKLRLWQPDDDARRYADTLRDEVLTAQVGILLHALIAVRRRAKELLDSMEDAP